MVEEHLFSLNKFSTPKILQGDVAVYILIARLILLEPGTIQSHPHMGVGIVSKYRYADESSVSALINDIQNQMAAYLPELQYAQVDVKYEKGAFKIFITIDNVVYDFSYQSDRSNSLDSLVKI